MTDAGQRSLVWLTTRTGRTPDEGGVVTALIIHGCSPSISMASSLSSVAPRGWGFGSSLSRPQSSLNSSIGVSAARTPPLPRLAVRAAAGAAS